MSFSANQLTRPSPVTSPPARPAITPQGRFGPTGAPALQGPQLPAYALRTPNPLMPPQATPPAVVQPNLHPPEPVRSSYGLEHQVSTRIPTAKGLSYDPHTRSDLKIDMASVKPNLDDPNEDKGKIQAWHRMWQGRLPTEKTKGGPSIREMYPHINTEGMSGEDAAEAHIGHIHDNIVNMWNRVRDRPWLHDAVHWYWGANKYAHDLSTQYAQHVKGGISHRQAAAAIAALSPQTDWNQNVNRVERMLNIMRDHKETEFSPEMHKFVHDQMMNRKNAKMRQQGLDELAGLKVGTKFKDIDAPLHQAFFARAHDELHNPDRTYPIFSPSGERFPHPRGYKVGWGSFDELHNAFKALKSDDLENISKALGDKHKVRNFYNNIIAPDSPDGHVTIDTHAINVGQLMPMGSKHLYVSHGLGSGGGIPSSAGVGAHGMYAMYADAYRRAAQTISRLEGRRYLPREVQSATWEAVNGLFDQAEHKAQHPQFLDKEKTIPNPEFGEPSHHVGKVAKHFFNLARYGVIPHAQAREAVVKAAGGINDPEWWQERQARLQPRS